MTISLGQCTLIIILVCFVTTAHAEPTVLTRTITHVGDGDIIKVGKISIRLNGVSAPELKELLGLQPKQFMRSLVDGKSVRSGLGCTKTYDPFVGTCSHVDKDIEISVVVSGLALNCLRFSGSIYASYEINRVAARVKRPKCCR